MLKDGTPYLCLYMLGKTQKIDIVHWGAAAMMVPKLNCWCNQSGMGLKMNSILKFKKLEEVLEIL